jgi:hypothetical protein
MGKTSWSGPIKAGTVREGASANLGNAVLSQTATITQNSTNAVDATFYIPANTQILSFNVDVLTAFNSGTSATFSAGTTSGGTQYVSGVDVKTATGRIAPTYTAAQLTAMADVTTNTTLVATVTPSGATSAGVLRVTVLYVQK